MVNHTDYKAQAGDEVQFTITDTQELIKTPVVFSSPGGETIGWWMEDDNYTFTMPASGVIIVLDYATADDV